MPVEGFGYAPDRSILFSPEFTEVDGKCITDIAMFKEALSRVDSRKNPSVFYVTYWTEVTCVQHDDPFGGQRVLFLAVLERLWIVMGGEF